MAETEAELEERLAKLKAARDRLVTGEAVESAGYQGRSVSYTKADLGTINRQIADIERKLKRSSPGPLRPRFW